MCRGYYAINISRGAYVVFFHQFFFIQCNSLFKCLDLWIKIIVCNCHGVAKSRTGLSDFTFTIHFSLSCIGVGNGNPLQCSCLENPRDGRAWWAAIYGVAQSRTQLKRLSSNSSSSSSITTTNKIQNIPPPLPPNSLKHPLFSQFLIPTSKQEVTDLFSVLTILLLQKFI